MRKKLTILLYILLFIILILGAAVLYDRLGSEFDAGLVATDQEADIADTPPETSEEPEEVPMAPDFTVLDQDGNEVKLSDFIGKPVVLNFWASWCGPCTYEMPEFESAWQEYGEDIVFMMVNMTDGSRETIDSATTFLENSGYTFPIYFDTASEAAIAYSVTSIPATYFIGADGSAVAMGQGMLSGENLLKGIGMILPQE